jgi:hypothetical protein
VEGFSASYATVGQSRGRTKGQVSKGFMCRLVFARAGGSPGQRRRGRRRRARIAATFGGTMTDGGGGGRL